MNFILFCPFITWLEFGDADIPLWWPSQGIHLPNPSHVSPVVKQGYFLALTIDDRMRINTSGFAALIACAISIRWHARVFPEFHLLKVGAKHDANYKLLGAVS